MKVYPLNGLVVYDPDKGGALPAKGREVTDNAYWRRRLRFGEVSLTAPASTAETDNSADVVETVVAAATAVAEAVASSTDDSTDSASSAADATEDGA